MIEFDPILVHDWLRRSAQRHPSKVALIVGEEQWCYASLNDRSDVLSWTLRSRGLHHQDRVLILLDNCSEAVIAMYGVLKAGAIFVLLSGSMKSKKLRYIFHNSGARFLITHTRKARVVSEAFASSAEKPSVIWIGANTKIPRDKIPCSLRWDELTGAQGAPDTCPGMNAENPRPLDIDLAALVYTSGTTGAPKGVMCTHRSMIAVAKSVIQYLDNRPEDRILNVLPLSFGYGLYQVIMAIMFGGTVILERSFMYPSHILERIGQERVTGFPLVPTMAAMWLRMEDMSPYRFDTLRYITSAGAALPSQHADRLQKRLPHVSIIPMYGLTECKRVSYLHPEELDTRPGSAGKAIPNCAVSLVDDHGNKVGPNQVGELVVRGSNVMQGYWGDPELTSRVFQETEASDERSLRTGDYFRMDDEGFLYFVGRKDDMINCKGERVSPQEIEECIFALDAVAEVAVVGVPDEIFGQAIKAYVVIHEGQLLKESDVLRICSQSLEAYMIPKFIAFTEELPRTANGKVNKSLLRQSEVLAS